MNKWILCAAVFFTSASWCEAQGSVCYQRGNGQHFIVNSVDEIVGNSSLQIARGDRSVCLFGGIVPVASFAEQVEVRDASNGCAIVATGQAVNINLSAAVVGSLCPLGSSYLYSRAVHLTGNAGASLSHLEIVCRRNSPPLDLISVRLFYTGSSLQMTSVGYPATCFP